ncbi:MAG: large-conductance mechanosensitive channel protein MscL [Longimicrobiales bacterium]
MLKEFREFVTRGNVLDLAVGVMIGAAFNKIVDSLVKDIIMPPIGVVLGGIDFSNFFLNISGTAFSTLAEAQAANAATVNYGLFINNVISFFIVAFAIFMIVKQVNRLRRPKAAEVSNQKECPFCRLGMPLAATRCPNCTSELQPA